MNWLSRDSFVAKLKIVLCAGLAIIIFSGCDGAKVVTNPEDAAASNACEVVQEIEEAIGTNDDLAEAEPTTPCH